MSYYIYAIIEGTEAQEFGEIGIGGAKVSTLPAKGLSAVVSKVGEKRLRPERRNLAAHQKVLTTLMATSTPLPVTFGVVAESQKAVQKVLSDNREALLAQGERVRGRMEMTLKVSLNVPDIFQYFVETHPDLRTARDRYYVKKRGPSHEDKIELGRMFDALLTKDRAAHTETVCKYLVSHSVEITENPCKDERLMMNLSCLVERSDEKAFEEAIFAAANHFDNSFSFDYNGPLVPHNFVFLELSL